MKRISAICVGLLATVASTAHGQLFNFPFHSLPTPGAAPSTFVVGTYGRGLNADSGELSAYGVGIGRAVGTRVTGFVGAGIVDLEPDARYPLGGAVSVALAPVGSLTQLALQAGVGYISFAADVSSSAFPLGLAVRRRLVASSGEAVLWAMPRVQVTRVSTLGSSDARTDFGASAGATLRTSGGLGLHAALDLLRGSQDAWLLGAGVQYLIP